MSIYGPKTIWGEKVDRAADGCGYALFGIFMVGTVVMIVLIIGFASCVGII
jgi:hypothetical protein